MIPFSDFVASSRKIVKPFKTNFDAIDFDSLADARLDERWLVDGVIPNGSFCILYGPPGTGKSFLVLDLAVAIATGGTWFGRRTEPCGVIMGSFEGKGGLIKRIRAYVQEKRPPTGIPLMALRRPVNLLTGTDDANRLIDECRSLGEAMTLKPGLLVLDTFARVMPGGNENSSEHVGLVIERVDLLQKALGVTVLAVHHTGKDGARGARGSSLILGAADTMIELGRDETRLISVKVKKQKDEADEGAFAFRLKRVVLETMPDGREVSSCVVTESDEVERNRAQRRAALRGPAKIAYQCLQQAILDHGQVLSEAIAPRGMKGVAGAKWRESCRRGGLLMIEKDQDEAEFDRLFKKMAQQLRAQSWIGIKDTWVWDARAGS